MSDRAILFLFSVFTVIASLAATGWLLFTGQAHSVDGLFLLLTCLVLALSFSLYLMFLIRRTMEAIEASQTQVAKPTAATQAKTGAPQAAASKTPAQPSPTSPAHSG